MFALLAFVSTSVASARTVPRHRHKAHRAPRTVSGGGAALDVTPTTGGPGGPGVCPVSATTSPSPTGTGTTGTGATGPGAGVAGTTTPTGPGAATPPIGAAPTPGASGGAGLGEPTPAPCTPAHPTVPGFTAAIIHGLAYAPAEAPAAVQRAIWAGNAIRTKPYIYGGGHGSFTADGYDCSGAVSYVLHAAGLLKAPMDSSDLLNWGAAGAGGWITVYTNPGHVFVDIAGIRLDTSAEADPHPAAGSGPRWRRLYTNAPGFTARHALGY